MITAADIRRQDADAIASLTRLQRAAIGRMAWVKQLGMIGEHSGKTKDERTQIVAEMAAKRANPLDEVFITPAGAEITLHKLDEPRPISSAAAEALFRPRTIDVA